MLAPTAATRRRPARGARRRAAGRPRVRRRPRLRAPARAACAGWLRGPRPSRRGASRWPAARRRRRGAGAAGHAVEALRTVKDASERRAAARGLRDQRPGAARDAGRRRPRAHRARGGPAARRRHARSAPTASPSTTIVATGPNSAIPHHRPTTGRSSAATSSRSTSGRGTAATTPTDPDGRRRARAGRLAAARSMTSCGAAQRAGRHALRLGADAAASTPRPAR